MERHIITEALRKKLEPLPYIYALWLEGADASGLVDEYSDLDYYVDFEDDYEEQAIEAVESALSELAEIDYKYVVNHGHPKLRQRIYHLSGTSEYLMIDFCWQLHSRDKAEYVYIKGNRVEAASVIFDKADIIRYKEYAPSEFDAPNRKRLEEAQYLYTQHSRVIKYVYRNQYPEAYAYYNKYVVEPLVDALRIIYTPANSHYYLIHISHHIPAEECRKLEYFLKITSVEEIAERISKAREWFTELVNRIKF